MIFRRCAGGVVFFSEKVFLLKNDKEEWVLPKGKIRNNSLASETAIERVKEEAGLDVQIISSAGETSYEFYSLSRQMQVCNQITWFIMDSANDDFIVNKEEGFIEGGFYSLEEAMDIITHNQEKSLVLLSYKKYLNLRNREVALV